QAAKNTFAQSLASLAGLSNVNRNPNKVGDIKTKLTPNTWEELRRQQSGYYDRIHEIRTALIYLRVKCEIESDPKAEFVRAHFLAVNHIERAWRKTKS